MAAWLTIKEMPNETGPARSRQGAPVLPSRSAIWDAVAGARAAGTAPSIPPPPRSVYPPALAAEDASWEAVEKNLASLEGWIHFAAWQPDGDAFWVSTNGFLSCVGVDGTVSPRHYTERLGLESGTWLPVAARWREVVPLAERTARVIYQSGGATFDGAPSANPTRHRLFRPLATAGSRPMP